MQGDRAKLKRNVVSDQTYHGRRATAEASGQAYRRLETIAIDYYNELAVTRGKLPGKLSNDRLRRDSAQVDATIWIAFKPHLNIGGV